MALTTVPKVKLHLGITSNDLDGQLAQFVEQADALIKNELSIDVEQSTYTEFYPGNGSPQLLLNHTPVQSITSAYEDPDAYYGEAPGAFASNTLLTAGVDYCLVRDNGSATEKSSSGILLRIGTAWPNISAKLAGMLTSSPMPGLGNVKVTYVAGYASVPYDLILACNLLVASIKRNAPHGGPISSESLDYYSYQLAGSQDSDADLASVKRILANYKRWVM